MAVGSPHQNEWKDSLNSIIIKTWSCLFRTMLVNELKPKGARTWTLALCIRRKKPSLFLMAAAPAWRGNQGNTGRSWRQSLSLREGGGGAHPRYVFRGRRGLFLRPPHVRDFVKEGYFFVPRYVRSMGVKIPLQSTKYTRLWRRVTPEVTGLPSFRPPLIKSKVEICVPVHQMSVFW